MGNWGEKKTQKYRDSNSINTHLVGGVKNDEVNPHLKGMWTSQGTLVG